MLFSSLCSAQDSLQLANHHTKESSDSVIVNQLKEKGIRFSHNNSVTLLMNGQEKFDDLFQAIRQAKKSVHLEYFNFRNDSIAGLLFDLLAEKAKQGVKVRALYDGFGNSSNNKPLRKRHIKEIRANGIEIYEYKPVKFPGFHANLQPRPPQDCCHRRTNSLYRRYERGRLLHQGNRGCGLLERHALPHRR